ncbi:MAG: DUF2157 domain-containing protein [Bacteroidota bacterium]
MTREQLWAIIKFSNLDKPQISKILDGGVYPNRLLWNRFLKIVLITLGAVFFVSGVVFFFAYNWSSLPNSAKLAIAQAAVVLTCAPYFFTRFDNLFRNISLTASAVLVGGMLAVFGQVYQTEALVYDLMLSWTLAISLWVIAARFAPLTLFWLFLLQVTIALLFEEKLHDYSELPLYFAITCTNLLALVLPGILSKMRLKLETPQWFRSAVASVCAYYMVSGFAVGLDKIESPFFIPQVILSLVVLAYLVRFGFVNRELESLAIASLSAIAIVCAIIIIKIDEGEAGLIAVTMLVLSSVVYLTKRLLHLKKSWNEEQQS